MLQRYIYCSYLHVQHWTLAIVGTHNNLALPAHVEKSHSPVHPPKRQRVTKFSSQFFFYKTYVSNRHLFWANIGRGSLLSPNIKIYNLICCPCTFQSYIDEVGTRSCQTVSKNSTCFRLRYHTVFWRFDIKRRILLLIILNAFKKGLDIGLC